MQIRRGPSFPIRASSLGDKETAASLAGSGRFLSLSNGGISKDQSSQRGSRVDLDVSPGEGAPGEERKAWWFGKRSK